MERSTTKIICDLCCNHMGNFLIAKKMIDEAVSCGADFIKLQRRDIESIPPDVYKKPYNSPHSFGSTYGAHRKFLEFSYEEFFELKIYTESKGCKFIATPFDIKSFSYLVNLGLPFIKVGSSQIHDDKFISFLESAYKPDIPPLIMSTGMCDASKVRELMNRIQPSVVMQTTSSYPCEEHDVHLKVLDWLKLLNIEIGLSGHYVSGNGAIEAAAVALGCTWIERHFTLDRTWKGTDQSVSLEPIGLRNVVKAVRTIERAMGDYKKEVLDCELPVLKKIRG